jgi:hypothetical protein
MKALIRLTELKLCPFDGVLRVMRVSTAYRVVVQATAIYFVAHPPFVPVRIAVDELPADTGANDIDGHLCCPLARTVRISDSRAGDRGIAAGPKPRAFVLVVQNCIAYPHFHRFAQQRIIDEA